MPDAQVIEHLVHTDSGIGFLMGVVMLVIYLMFLFYFALPLLRQGAVAPQFKLPEKIDVNIQP